MGTFTDGWLAALTLASALVWPGTSLAFDLQKDTLCFNNFDPGFTRHGPPFLGKYATKTGACQGMVGIMAAFHEHAEFAPSRPAPSRDEAKKLIKRLLKLHRKGCDRSSKIEVPGYEDLRSFCQAYREAFFNQSVWNNLDIATHEIAPHYFEMKRIKRNPIGVDRREELAASLYSLAERLQSGRLPLMLYHSHVVLVISVTQSEVITIDPNTEGLRAFPFSFDADGLPSASNIMIWDVTPERSPDSKDCL